MKYKKKKIAVILGTRPEIIKLAPILFELGKYKKYFKTDIIWSGQHLQLAKPFLKTFHIQPNHDLKIMRPNQSSPDICSRTMKKLDKLLKRQNPDIVMIQGDTTTAFTASLCAYYNRIPVAHIEAGLRSGNPHHPFPEEKNRELISHVTNLQFAPTALAKKNLLKEGVDPKSIFVVGNSVIDAVKWLLKEYPSPKKLDLIDYDPKKDKLLVVTAHRRESFGRPLQNICRAIVKLARKHNDLKIILPVHLNPNVSNIMMKKLKGISNIYLTKPLDYVSFIHLLIHSTAILTDSGGIQEEAPGLGKPLLIAREVTERPEGVKAGSNRLVGRETNAIISAVETILYNPNIYQKMSRVRYPFGKGNTAKKVVQVLKKYFN